MHTVHRHGSSLCEVLLALALLSATAAWGLAAATAAERAVGRTNAHRAALHRAERALADLDALPCDSANITRNTSEPRWRVLARRTTTTATGYRDDILLHTTLGDSIRVQSAGWCR